MSSAVSFEHFCTRYELDCDTVTARTEYEKYLANLDMLNAAFAEDISTKATIRAADEARSAGTKKGRKTD